MTGKIKEEKEGRLLVVRDPILSGPDHEIWPRFGGQSRTLSGIADAAPIE